MSRRPRGGQCAWTYSASTRWTNEIAIDPSPTADATRLTLPHRTSPTANTPGRDVSSRYGERSRGHLRCGEILRCQIGSGLDEPFRVKSDTAIEPSSTRHGPELPDPSRTQIHRGIAAL